jgi:hypothetical protein
MSEEIVPYKNNKSFIPEPTTFDDAWKMATILAASDLVPKEFKGKPENCLIAMQWGSDIGLPGLQALQNIAIINGKPSIYGDAAKALVISRADCEDIQEYFDGEGGTLTAVCVVKRRGKSAVTSTFSIADAKLAGLFGKLGPWTQYRNRMLQMRARSFALRDAFPDALKGLILAEEAQDYPKEKEINPLPERKLPKPESVKTDKLGGVLYLITQMDSKDKQNRIKTMIAELNDVEQGIADAAYKKRVAELKKALKPIERDWQAELDAVISNQQLSQLQDAMPDVVYQFYLEEIQKIEEKLDAGKQDA